MRRLLIASRAPADLVVNMHLVLITYLQHTDTYIPHWRDGDFNWLRGALSTADRSYGWGMLDWAFHRITDTHLAHHLFHEMPFYYAEEATRAIIPIVGDYYLKDHRSIPRAIWTSVRDCKSVPAGGGALFYQRSAPGTKSE